MTWIAGLFWYVGSVLLWWLISGVYCNYGFWPFNAFLFCVGVNAFFYALFWISFTAWTAIGEVVLFRNYPDREAVFYAFLLGSLVAYSLSVKFGLMPSPRYGELWKMVIWPAVAVSAMYVVRRKCRTAKQP